MIVIIKQNKNYLIFVIFFPFDFFCSFFLNFILNTLNSKCLNCSCSQRRKIRCGITAEYWPFGRCQHYYWSYDWIRYICIAQRSIEILGKHRFVPYYVGSLRLHFTPWYDGRFSFINISKMKYWFNLFYLWFGLIKIHSSLFY